MTSKPHTAALDLIAEARDDASTDIDRAVALAQVYATLAQVEAIEAQTAAIVETRLKLGKVLDDIVNKLG
jgi:hypothetical protein